MGKKKIEPHVHETHAHGPFSFVVTIRLRDPNSLPTDCEQGLTVITILQQPPTCADLFVNYIYFFKCLRARSARSSPQTSRRPVVPLLFHSTFYDIAPRFCCARVTRLYAQSRSSLGLHTSTAPPAAGNPAPSGTVRNFSGSFGQFQNVNVHQVWGQLSYLSSVVK
ncbi:hypothetical protein BJV78DRAFT_376262 [Lactifluus subvellereus]|nr:hypothetical protein BJV78DRAFT_376262 [Lactifluus subvellereus]